MELTKNQEEGLKIALDRHRAHEKYTVISGYAGTGKSTLVKFIIDALQVSPSKVAYATFTGKAAEVLRKKGNQNAITLHKLLYDNFPLPAGGFKRVPKPSLDYSVVVVDEVSMVPKEMVELLLTHKVYIIFLGDPFQLPQISPTDAHDLLEHPHIFLDEVMRQAKESEIIRVSMDIREGKDLSYFHGQEVQILPYKDLVEGCYLWADQIITATNQMRQQVNKHVRKLLGFEGDLCKGEKVICLRNYWEDIFSNGDALVNGTIGYIKNPMEQIISLPRFIRSDIRKLNAIECILETEKGITINTSIDKNLLITGEKCLDWRVCYQLNKMKYKIGDIIPKEFDYGYAITCHKAQGSSWEKVLVLEENFPFIKLDHARWLYTACTRPEKKLVIVR